MKRIARHSFATKPGIYVAPGEEADLTKAEEQRLEAAGALEDKDGRKKAAAGPVKPTGAALGEALVEAIKALDPKAEDAWTGTGKPSAIMLGMMLGYPVGPVERDAAWEQAQAAGVKAPAAPPAA